MPIDRNTTNKYKRCFRYLYDSINISVESVEERYSRFENVLSDLVSNLSSLYENKDAEAVPTIAQVYYSCIYSKGQHAIDSGIFDETLPKDKRKALVVSAQILDSLVCPQEPHLKDLFFENYLDTEISLFIHFAKSLIQELGAQKSPTKNTLVDIVARQLLLREYFELQFESKDSIKKENVAANEIKQNLPDLEHLQTLTGIDYKHLFGLQTDYWELITSNQVRIVPDMNYRLTVNSKPGTHHSLFAYANPIARNLISYQGDYLDFVEATSGCDIYGLRNTFGFEHQVIDNAHGENFIIEYPLIMLDNQIFMTDYPNITRILDFEKDFERNHDLLHHLLPVYAEHFVIHHPDAPLTYGGYLSKYLNFARATRTRKNDYEVGLGIIHRNIKNHPNFALHKKKQIDLLIATLEELHKMQEWLQAKNLQEKLNVVHHLAVLFIVQAMTVYYRKDPAYDSVKKLVQRLSLPEIQVHLDEVLFVLFAQRLIKVDGYNLKDNEEGDKERFISCMGAFTLEQKNALLSSLHYKESFSEPGSNYIIELLKELGLLNVWETPTQSLGEFDICLWYSIVMPQKPSIMGYAEKIHKMTHIMYGNSLTEPELLLTEQYACLSPDLSAYDERKALKDTAVLVINALRRLDQDQKDATIQECLYYLLTSDYLKFKDLSVDLKKSVILPPYLHEGINILNNLIAGNNEISTYINSKQKIFDKVMSLG